jgi:hypothetical protein
VKHTFFPALFITSMMSVFCLSSCKKIELSVPDLGSGGSSLAFPAIINLQTGQWIKDTNGFFDANFPSILPAGSGTRHVEIYLLENGQKTQINQFIFYRDGELWATYNSSDVKITYQSGREGINPYQMNIEVDIQ